VVDNEHAIVCLLVEALKRHGLEADWTSDGREAVRRAERGEVEVVVCDLGMPGFTGDQVVAAIARMPKQPRVLVMTGYLSQESEERLSSLPCVAGFLAKPFDIFSFSLQVASLLPPRTGEPEGGDRVAPWEH
jgi:CheY-like chemotaxis protein